MHCTCCPLQVYRDGYIEEFLAFWSKRREVKKIWMSLYTPQLGESSPEKLSAADRERVVGDLPALRLRYPKLEMPKEVLEAAVDPPQSPAECVFARTIISADLTTKVTPCQFGGAPDCANCGCLASAGLAAVGRYRLFGFIPVGSIFAGSLKIGEQMRRLRPSQSQAQSVFLLHVRTHRGISLAGGAMALRIHWICKSACCGRGMRGWTPRASR